MPTPTPHPIALGVFEPGAAAVRNTSLDQYAQQVGKMPAMVWFPQNWGDPAPNSAFNASQFDALRARGAVPIVSWEPSVGDPLNNLNQPQYSWASIAGGGQDAYITQWAQDAKNYGYPLYVRMFHELNGGWYPWGNNVNGNTNTATFTTAWRHVVGIFRSVGASNVQFIWCASTSAGTANDAALYPGDAYVDWVAMDGYNQSTSTWTTLYNRFQPTYTTLVGLTTKPLLIFETASLEGTTGKQVKSTWITTGFLTDLPQSFPRVQAVMWYNQTGGSSQSYPVDSTSASLSAWQQVVANSYYQAVMPQPSALPTATPGPCPSGWNCADIGGPAIAGTQYVNGGAWTVKGSGADIFGTSDQFHFIWQPLSANASISARVDNVLNVDFSKGGVMLRQSTDAGSPYYAAYLGPYPGLLVDYRDAQGATAVEQLRTLTDTVPEYVKVASLNGNCTAYTSTDGTTWIPVAGSTVSLSMTNPLAGVAVTSHNVGYLTTATFDSVSAQ